MNFGGPISSLQCHLVPLLVWKVTWEEPLSIIQKRGEKPNERHPSADRLPPKESGLGSKQCHPTTEMEYKQKNKKRGREVDFADPLILFPMELPVRLLEGWVEDLWHAAPMTQSDLAPYCTLMIIVARITILALL